MRAAIVLFDRCAGLARIAVASDQSTNYGRQFQAFRCAEAEALGLGLMFIGMGDEASE